MYKYKEERFKLNRNKKILVIENDLNLYTKLSSGNNKFYKILANSGTEGLKIAVKYQPDIIICDFQLNDLKCDKLFQQIRKKIAHKSIPFIVITDDIDNQSIQNLKRFPDVIIIRKPVETEKLHQEIDKILDPHPSEFSFDTISIKADNEKQKYEYIFIDQGKRLSTIKTDEIICALAKGNYTYIFSTEGKKYVVRKLLKEITEILPKETF